MSAVAALAVTSPFAVFAVAELAPGTKPAPQHHDFVQAAVVTDLPNELMSALQQGLSQFGINLPPLPTGLSPAGAQPPATGLTPGLTTPGLTTPGLTPGVTTPNLTDPTLTNPALTPPLTNPALTPPLTGPPGATPAGLTGPNPTLTSPIGSTPGMTGAPGEVPITAPLGPDPASGTYPILGDPSLGMPTTGMPTTGGGGGGGIISELTNAANQLGMGQAIDLLKGVVVPSITQAIQGAASQAAAPLAPPPEPAG